MYKLIGPLLTYTALICGLGVWTKTAKGNIERTQRRIPGYQKNYKNYVNCYCRTHFEIQINPGKAFLQLVYGITRAQGLARPAFSFHIISQSLDSQSLMTGFRQVKVNRYAVDVIECYCF